ncbi:asparagine synthase-related protein [Actinopolyspora lacussalsi]|uniref:asparagine synthase-related protein n=1 Tax=Actinopolyspora righensis TaxID=995060 RepID=UPI001587C5E2|nr:asparagine synthase-related protein [Actinopolyspora righensis]
MTVAADRPERIAELAGAGIDERALALRMLVPYGPPWPLSQDCLWQGVREITGGEYLRVAPDGAGRTVRWWRPPEPEVPLEEGSETIREALSEAVLSCGGPNGSVPLSFDLSGGMDSTSLCFLADEAGLEFSTVHYEAADPANDDNEWASRCRSLIGASDHRVLPPGSWSGFYGEVSEPDRHGPSLEGPYNQVSRCFAEHLAGVAAETGAIRHVGGHGSDELFRTELTFLNAFLREHPVRAIPALRRTRANRRMSLLRALRCFRRAPGFAEWLRRAGENITEEVGAPEVGWDHVARMPAWATRDAISQTRERFAAAAAECPEPFGATPLRHEMLMQARSNGETVRQCSRIAEPYGISFEAPYIDDRVIEAAMSIRLSDRASGERNKPVLASAMSGVVPHEFLHRDYKGAGNQDMYRSLRRHRAAMGDLCDDSRLARLGLVDPERLRDTVFGLHPNLTSVIPLQPTLACEMWLRSRAAESRLCRPS